MGVRSVSPEVQVKGPFGVASTGRPRFLFGRALGELFTACVPCHPPLSLVAPLIRLAPLRRRAPSGGWGGGGTANLPYGGMWGSDKGKVPVRGANYRGGLTARGDSAPPLSRPRTPTQ